MTPADRALAYHTAFPKWPELAYTAEWLYGVWEIGNDYRNASPFYGAYPRGYLKRLQSIFPEHPMETWLHPFSGSLRAETPGLRIDINPANQPHICADAHTLSSVLRRKYPFAAVDPPYSKADAVRYGTPMVNRRKVMAELAQVIQPGGHVAWLDTVLPMYRKIEWRRFGAIGIVRSTNHRVRFVFLFERRA